jgi:hypothetical protein
MSIVPETPPPQGKTSRLAIASLVCGLATIGLICVLAVLDICELADPERCMRGQFMCIPGALVGFILGLVAHYKIVRSLVVIRGKRMANVGVLVSGLSILIAFFLPALIGVFHFTRRHEMAINIGHVAHVAMMYAKAHDGRLPPADSWPQALEGTEAVVQEFMYDPFDRQAGRVVAMNARLSGVKLDSITVPDQTVLFFECAQGDPPAGGPENCSLNPRHRWGILVRFVSGRDNYDVKPEDIAKLKWDP